MNTIPRKYKNLLKGLKSYIEQARVQAAFQVNAQLLQVYWEIGNTILQQQKKEGWGTRVIDRLAADLRAAFPDMKGLSDRNIKYMRAFAEAYPAIVQQAVAKIPWGHHLVLLNQVKEPEAREFYMLKTIEHRWSRTMLVHHIETSLHLRQGKTINNFALTLPQAQSDLAKEAFKNPFMLDFIQASEHIC